MTSVIYTPHGIEGSFVLAGTTRALDGVGSIRIPLVIGVVFFEISTKNTLSGKRIV